MLLALFDCPTLSTVLPQNLLVPLTTLIYSMAVNHNYDPTYIGPHKVLCVRAVLVAVVLFLTQIYSGRMHGKSQDQVESSQLGHCSQETERAAWSGTWRAMTLEAIPCSD